MAKISILLRLRAFVFTVIRLIAVVFDRIPTKLIFIIGASLAFLIFLCSLGTQALTSIFLFDGYAADGAFQSLNPLRRLAAGEVIGRDFNFFHGVAVPLIHMPLYYLFGQGLFASEIARWVVSPALFVGSTFLFFYVFKRRFVFAFAMTAAVTTVVVMLVPFLIFPLTSMLGVRSTLPVLLLVLIMLQARFKKPVAGRFKFIKAVTWYELLAGLLLALAFITGTEFGLAALLAFLIVNTFYKTDVKSRLKQRLLSSLRVLGLFFALLFGLLAVITRGNPLEPLKYALLEVPADQFWYFGASPNKYLNLGNILGTLLSDEKLMIILAFSIVTLGLVYYLHRLGGRRIYCQAFIFALLAGLFAMISMLGYYHYSEASNLARMALLVGGASLAIMFSYWKNPIPFKLEINKLKLRINITPKGTLKVIGLTAIIMLVMLSVKTFAMLKEKYDFIGLTDRMKEYALGQNSSMLGRHWNEVLSEVIPVINADNYVNIVDINDQGFMHGIGNDRQAVVEPDEHSSFIRPGQAVYFTKSGRQIIEKVETRPDGLLLVTLESRDKPLDPNFDGAPAKMIVAEDFQKDNTKVWSLYGGMLEHETGLLHPSREGYDYIIHALGEERRQQYLDDFKQTKSQFVVTLHRPYFVYDEWIQNAHWDLYSLINSNYQVVKESSIYIIWERRDQPWVDSPQHKWQPLNVDEQQGRINLPELSFNDIPDIESYVQSQKQAANQRKGDMGVEIPQETCVSLEEHEKLIKQENDAIFKYYLSRRENSGPDTNAKERQEWDRATSQNADVMVPGEPPAPDPCNTRPKRRVILVRLNYETSHPLQALPVLGRTTRFLVEPNNTFNQTTVSLRPHAKEVIFPLVISELNHDPYLQLNSNSLLPGSAGFKITNAAWAPLDVSPISNLKALTESHE